MNAKEVIEQRLQTAIEGISDMVDEQSRAASFNMKWFVRTLVGRLLYENDHNPEYHEGKQRAKDVPVYMGGDLDDIVDAIMDTSHYTDREDGENYPVWNERRVKEQMERIRKALKRAEIA